MKKIKSLTQVGNSLERTDTQLETSSINGIITSLKNNPMKTDKGKKNSWLKKGMVMSPLTLFQKGNQFGKLNKGKVVTQEQKIKQSMKMKGRPANPKSVAWMKKMLQENNPMKNPEISRKNAMIRSKILKGRPAHHKTREGLLRAALNQSKKINHPARNELKSEIIKLYTEDKLAFTAIAKKFGIDKNVVKKVLIENSISIRPIQVQRSMKGGIHNEKINNIGITNDCIPNLVC